MRFSELRQKEVINIKDGCRYGVICDLEINTHCGDIVALIMPGESKMFGIFGYENEYFIPWDKVVKIGDDIILVDCDPKKVPVKDC